MKKVFFVFILLLSALSYGQETSIVRGQILDGELYNEPLLMASVSIENTPISTQTNFRGNFEFNDLAPGSYNLSVQFLGYEALELSVDIKAGENIELLETLYAKKLSLPLTEEFITAEKESESTASKPMLKR